MADIKLSIIQFLQTTFEIISAWTIFLSVTTCILTMLALLQQFVPPTVLYKLSCLHYITLHIS